MSEPTVVCVACRNEIGFSAACLYPTLPPPPHFYCVLCRFSNYKRGTKREREEGFERIDYESEDDLPISCTLRPTQEEANLENSQLCYKPLQNFDIFGLPNEIILHVLSNFSQKELFTMASTSSSFRTLVYDHCFWKTVDIKKLGIKHVDHVQSLINAVGVCTAHLDMDCCLQQVDDHVLDIVGKNCKLLETLNVRFCMRISDEGIQHVCAGSQKLKILKLSGCFKLTATCLASIGKLTKLEHLDMMFCPLIPADAYVSHLSGLTNLHSLYLWTASNRSHVCVINQLKITNSLMAAGGKLDFFLEGDKKKNAISFNDRYPLHLRSTNPALSRALDYFLEAMHYHHSSISHAIELYKKSINCYPLADAHTYLGWMYSMSANFHQSITECYKAIQLDPEFGNPWNDLGSYFKSLNLNDAAIIFLEKAKQANRYECRDFPHCNLALVYKKLGNQLKVFEEYCQLILLTPWVQSRQVFMPKLEGADEQLFSKFIKTNHFGFQ